MSGLLERYHALVAAGELRPDAEQAAAAERLAQLQLELEAPPAAAGLVNRLLGRKPPPRPRGLYLWGGVGRGKSMLMDLFFADAPVAAALARNRRVLAFDEMVVNNSADAMIMSRLFTALIVTEGVTIVTTSNRVPGDLYKNGLNREHFLPFIAMIERDLDVLPLNGPTDYRLDRLGGIATWYAPLGEAATARARDAFFRLTDYPPEDSAHVPSAELAVGGGRTLFVPKCLKGVAVFSFKRLCGEARGASDYLAVAQTYHTVIVVGIPRLGADQRNETARFVTLIDALYEHTVKLIAAAAAPPDDLYDTSATGNADGRFEFDRTVSRLMEMQSEDYLALGHGED